MRSSPFLLVALLLSGTFWGCSSETQWFSLFNGRDLEGWRAAENESTFRVEDGAIVCNGPRAHLFYVGDVAQANFKNFEFEAEVKTTPGSNSGIYFHTEYQDSGWPSKGYECQVLNSNRAESDSGFVEHKMTGSLYARTIPNRSIPFGPRGWKSAWFLQAPLLCRGMIRAALSRTGTFGSGCCPMI
ncbi:MAG: DUF1080 domain-containing protein [Acidobacteriota bacterium]